jgi:glyoxylase-like metal-dependent hydrolase (beta-lactamase superfamily II)
VKMPVRQYRLDEIADGVVAAIATPDGGGRGNAAIVRLNGQTLVFDTGMTPQAGEELCEVAETLGPVRWVVNSHWHADHIRGNQAFGDAEIVATTRTKELIMTRGAEQVAEHKATDFERIIRLASRGRRAACGARQVV